MTELKDAAVLVVGATGGLGGAISRALAERGARLALSGRRADRLRTTGVAGVPVVVDLREPPHTETGLAGRPIAGESPKLPPGLDPTDVATRIVEALAGDEIDLPTDAFSARKGHN